MQINDQTWHVVKSVPKITGFVGGGKLPPSVPTEEVEKITTKISEGTLEPKVKISFEKGDSIRVVDGPFSNFNGVVDEGRRRDLRQLGAGCGEGSGSGDANGSFYRNRIVLEERIPEDLDAHDRARGGRREPNGNPFAGDESEQGSAGAHRGNRIVLENDLRRLDVGDAGAKGEHQDDR